MVDQQDWLDKTFPRDQFMIGDQLVGEVPPTGLWYPKPFAILVSCERSRPGSTIKYGSEKFKENCRETRRNSGRQQ
jgi:hypothetical protein